VIHIPGRLQPRVGRRHRHHQQELARWTDASIWLQGDLDVQERQLWARDGDSLAQQQHMSIS
jgi:hypothetical protein